jgi:hypothetical protein
LRQLHRSLLLALLVGVVLPAAARAGALNAARDAELRSAVGSLSITETRCRPGSADCRHLTLRTRFASGHHLRVRHSRGRAQFALGVRLSGRGSGECAAESPAVLVTAPDGSMQLLGGAQRVEPASSDATGIFIGAGRRGARWAWREPLAPGFRCVYFDQPGYGLALPRSVPIPTSAWIPAHVLRRSHFTVTVAGSRAWAGQAADGSTVTGHARWRLRLRYSR